MILSLKPSNKANKNYHDIFLLYMSLFIISLDYKMYFMNVFFYFLVYSQASNKTSLYTVLAIFLEANNNLCVKV